MNPFVAADGRLRAMWRFLIGVFVAWVAMNFAAGLALHAGSPTSLWFEVVYRPLWAGLLIISFAILLVVLDGVSNPLPVMGLPRGWKNDTVTGLAIGAGMVVVSAAVVAVGGKLNFTAEVNGRVLARVAVVVFILATAAMAEELAFRGYPFQRLIESAGQWPAICVMSLLFGAVHLTNPNASATGFINTALIGGVLSLAYVRSRALWVPFGIHLGWNATLGLVLGLPVSGLREFSVLVVGHARGPAWLTGGSYGIEASLNGTVVILLGFLAVVAFVPKRAAPTLDSALLPEAPTGAAETFPDPATNPDGVPPPSAHPTE